MKIQLSEHFTYNKLLRFVFPSIVMMIFTSIYGVVDGLFVSNYAGKTAFAAINLIMPFIMALSALGFMVGTGGSAIVAKTLGEGKEKEANRYLSMLIYLTIFGGIVLSVLGILLARPVSIALGASGDLLDYCTLYGRITFGLLVIVLAGVTNMVLDYLFIAVFGMGLVGAAIATVCGECIGGFVPLIYFAAKNSSPFRLGKTKWYPFILKKTCTNGSSELMTNLSSSIVNTLFNFQLMRFVGENGVAAYGTIMYVNFIFVAIYFGYSIGSAPIVSYHYGAQNHKELKNLLNKSLRFTGICGIFMFILAQLIATPLARIFVGYDVDLFELTRHGFRIYCTTFLVCGLNIYGSSFFTALNNGLLSALISFLRTLVFQVSAVLILPIFFAIDGIWSSVLLAELLTLVVTAICIIKKRSRYHYF